MKDESGKLKRKITLPTFIFHRFRFHLLFIRPVAGEFLKVGERGQVAHAVEINFAVQMVPLVLNNARVKAGRDEVEFRAAAVLGAHADFFIARHAAPKFGNAEAAFPIFFHLLRKRLDLEIYQNGKRNRGLLGIARIVRDLEDGDLQ